MEKPKLKNNTETLDKRKRWEDKKREIDAIVDGMGTPIDEGIKETVVALQLFGLQTTASHEGRIGRYPIPYVDIESMESDGLLEKYYQDIFSHASPEYLSIRKESEAVKAQLSSPNISDEEYDAKSRLLEELHDRLVELPDLERSPESEALLTQIQNSNGQAEQVLQSLLDEFYSDRSTNDDFKLTIKHCGIFNSLRLLPSSYEVQENEKEERAIADRLASYQEEVKQFTEFLKSKL